MSTKKETVKEKSKSRTKSTKECDISVEEGTEKVGTEKQVKIDSMLSQMVQKEKEPDVADLISVISAFDKKLSLMASKEYIEKSLSKLVSADFVNDKLDSLRRDLGSEIKSEMEKMSDQLKCVNDKLLKTVNEIEELKNTNSDIEENMKRMQEENVRIKQKNEELEELMFEREKRMKANEVTLNNLEQYTRKNSIRIYGIEDKNKDETMEQSRSLVIKLFNDKLSIKLTNKDIDIAHRLGQFSKEGNRPIICKFVSRSTKFDVISARRQLKGSAIVIREDLTTRNAKLLESVSAKPEVANAWSHDGKIIALLLNGKKTRFDLNSDLGKSLIPSDELEKLLEEKSKTSVKK